MGESQQKFQRYFRYNIQVKSQLLETKLHPPNIQKKWTNRPFINALFDEGMQPEKKITLISAPAGYGKSSSYIHWLATRKEFNAWISLDQNDNNLLLFLQYLLAALQTISEDIGKGLSPILENGQLPSIDFTISTLINDITAYPETILLVLDDFHLLLEEQILQIFSRIIEHQPPNLHITLITREDPALALAQLRARNQIVEIRSANLRFAPHEVSDFFVNVLGIKLTDKQLQQFENKTEGWIAGLQLAGLSIRNTENSTAILDQLEGNNQYFLNYLSEQVLQQQPENIQKFLLFTSPLKLMNASLCNAITGRTDSQTILNQLNQSNLFTIALDSKLEWFRYHHLFSDLLQDKLLQEQKEKIETIHLKACEWYLQQNMIHEAIPHAIKSNNQEIIVDVLDKYGTAMIMQGYGKILEQCMEELSDQQLFYHPRTIIVYLWMTILGGIYYQLSDLLQRLEIQINKISRTGVQHPIEAEWLVIKALNHFRLNEIGNTIASAKESLDKLPENDDLIRSMAQYALASAYMQSGQKELANKHYHLAIKHGRKSDNQIAVILSISCLGTIALENGKIHLSFQIVSEAIDQMRKKENQPLLASMLYGLLGTIYMHRLQFQSAEENIHRLQSMSQTGGFNTANLFSHILLAQCYLLENQTNKAFDEIQQAEIKLPHDSSDYVHQEFTACKAQIYLKQEQSDAAAYLLQPYGFSFDGYFQNPEFNSQETFTFSKGFLFCTALQTWIAKHKNLTPELSHTAIQFTQKMIDLAAQNHQELIRIHTLLLRAIIYHQLNISSDAARDLEKVLTFSQQENFQSIYLLIGTPLHNLLSAYLQTYPDNHSLTAIIQKILEPTTLTPILRSTQLDLIEPLSEREIAVLQLLAQGLKYSEIAEKLVVSINTIRTHSKAIYRKLDVNNKTQAVNRARKINLI